MTYVTFLTFLTLDPSLLLWHGLAIPHFLFFIWRPSQVSFPFFYLASSQISFRNFATPQALLNPGDVLYVPPHWFHHVQSITPCISLASWSSSGVHNSLSHLYKQYPEWSQFGQVEAQQNAIMNYIEMILERTHSRDQMRKFLQDMVTTRWSDVRKLIGKRSGHPLEFVDSKSCHKVWAAGNEEILNDLKKHANFASDKFSACQGSGLCLL